MFFLNKKDANIIKYASSRGVFVVYAITAMG
jgi:hypothetical protein